MVRYKFNKRDRQPGESIPFYVIELKHLSEHCDFGVTLENMIRDRLVGGVRSRKIQQHLFAKTEPSFDKALKITSVMETAEKNICDIEELSRLEKMEGLNKVQEKHDKFDEIGRKKGLKIVMGHKIVFNVGVIIFKVNAVLKMPNVIVVGK